MVAHRGSSPKVSRTNIEPLIQLWLLRILIPLGGHRDFVESYGFRDDRIAEALGLGQWIDLDFDFLERDFDQKSVRIELRAQHIIAEKKAAKTYVSACLAGNVDRLSGLVGLTETDCRVLEFVVLLNNDNVLADMVDFLGPLSSIKLFHALSVILGLPENDIRDSLHAQSILAQSGLVSLDRNGTSHMRTKLDILSENFADHIFSSDADPISLLRDTVAISSPPQLKIKDYEHLNDELGVLMPYLKKSIAMSRVGINVLLHGAPGTGKSQLAKVLAKGLGCELFDVASEDEDGDPISGGRRLRAFRAAQNFFAKRNSLIVFDEVQDVFDDGGAFFGMRSTAQTSKAWINRMLEENPVPTFWLTNSAQCIDQAFIRRFDMVIELPVPPKKQRQKIIKKHCSRFLSNSAIEQISESEDLAPAVVTRTASVVLSIESELGDDAVSSAFELIINNTLKTQGHKPIHKGNRNKLPETYDPAYIHADTDITQVGLGLSNSQSGRLCLYGAPGTGKTAYGRWIAQQMGAPLMVKRASDLLSMWVGGNEQNIANAFKEAEAEGAVLLLDEVDSFLRDRRGAERGWEVSQVNEMLTQMETFPGVFIATTNLMTGLDQAALRRFDLKIKFDFLKQDQAWGLLQKHCKSLDVARPHKSLKRSLDALNNLTPGDFAAVSRRHRFNPITSAKAMIVALAAECAIKEGVKRAIGFIH